MKLPGDPSLLWRERFRGACELGHRTLWTGAIAAFLCMSVPNLIRETTRYPIQLVGPLHSSNVFLSHTTGQTDAAERLIALFDAIPHSALIAIFVKAEDTRSSSLGMTIAYLAWPHPVRVIDIAQWSRENDGPDSPAPGAFAFCRINRPPWLPAGERFGDALEVVPVTATAKR